MEHGIKNGTTNIHVSKTKLNKNTPIRFCLLGVYLFKIVITLIREHSPKIVL